MQASDSKKLIERGDGQGALTHVIENQGPLNKRDDGHAIEIPLERTLYHCVKQLDNLGIATLQPQGERADGIKQQDAKDIALSQVKGELVLYELLFVNVTPVQGNLSLKKVSREQRGAGERFDTSPPAIPPR